MARNLIDLVDSFEEDDVDLFEKLGHSNRRKYNKMNDSREQIKKQRREKQRIRETASNKEDY